MLLFITWVRSFSKVLPYVKIAKDKVLVFIILCKNCANLSLTLILTLIS